MSFVKRLFCSAIILIVIVICNGLEALSIKEFSSVQFSSLSLSLVTLL